MKLITRESLVQHTDAEGNTHSPILTPQNIASLIASVEEVRGIGAVRFTTADGRYSIYHAVADDKGEPWRETMYGTAHADAFVPIETLRSVFLDTPALVSITPRKAGAVAAVLRHALEHGGAKGLDAGDVNLFLSTWR